MTRIAPQFLRMDTVVTSKAGLQKLGVLRAVHKAREDARLRQILLNLLGSSQLVGHRGTQCSCAPLQQISASSRAHALACGLPRLSNCAALQLLQGIWAVACCTGLSSALTCVKDCTDACMLMVQGGVRLAGQTLSSDYGTPLHCSCM